MSRDLCPEAKWIYFIDERDLSRFAFTGDFGGFLLLQRPARSYIRLITYNYDACERLYSVITEKC